MIVYRSFIIAVSKWDVNGIQKRKEKDNFLVYNMARQIASLSYKSGNFFVGMWDN